MPGALVVTADSDGIERIRDLRGADVDRIRVAFLDAGDRSDLELFEFADTAGVSDTRPSDVGFFHVGVVDVDLEGLAARIDDAGGEHYADVWDLYPGFEATYCSDLGEPDRDLHPRPRP